MAIFSSPRGHKQIDMKYELLKDAQAGIEKIITETGIDLSGLSMDQISSMARKISIHVEERIFDVVNKDRGIKTYNKYCQIRKNYNSEGGFTLQQLADRENVSVTVITSVVKGTYWID